MGHETHQKDSYNFSFGTIGGRKNKYNISPGHGKPSKHGKPPKQEKPSSHHQGVAIEHSTNSNIINSPVQSHPQDQTEEVGHNNHHFGQSPAPQQGVFVPAPTGAYACAYATPYPYQCPPPPYPHQGGYQNGGYHVQGYPGSVMPYQGGYGSYGGAHMGDIGMVGAAAGVAVFGMFKLLRERRRHGGGRY